MEHDDPIRVWLSDVPASKNDLPAAYRPLADYFDDEDAGSRTTYLAHIPAAVLSRGALGTRGPQACFFDECAGFLGTDRVEVFPEPAGNGALVVGGVGDVNGGDGAREPDDSETSRTIVLYGLDLSTGERAVVGSLEEPASPETREPELRVSAAAVASPTASPFSFVRIWACDTIEGRAATPQPYQAFVRCDADGSSDTSYIAHVPAALLREGAMRALGPAACFGDFGYGLGLMGANALDTAPDPHEDGRVVVGSCV